MFRRGEPRALDLARHEKGAAMSDAGDISRDPRFREQFVGAAPVDPEFEAALGGSVFSASVRPVSQPLAPQMPWQQPTFQRLR